MGALRKVELAHISGDVGRTEIAELKILLKARERADLRTKETFIPRLVEMASDYRRCAREVIIDSVCVPDHELDAEFVEPGDLGENLVMGRARLDGAPHEQDEAANVLPPPVSLPMLQELVRGPLDLLSGEPAFGFALANLELEARIGAPMRHVIYPKLALAIRTIEAVAEYPWLRSVKGSGKVLKPLGPQLPKVVLVRSAFRQSQFGFRQD